MVGAFWKVLMNDVLSINNYDAHPDTAKLKPWDDVMSTGTSYSIENYDTNIWDIIKSDKVNIYIGEIDHLSPGKVHLSDGTALESDALLAHTGWKQAPNITFLPLGIEKDLAIPAASTNSSSEIIPSNQQSALDQADAAIVRQFPILAQGPAKPLPASSQPGLQSNDSFMLYHFLVPASERFLKSRDIAFVGFASCFSNAITAHIQGLWVSAYFNGQLTRDPSAALGDKDATEIVQQEAVLHNRFGKWRYPADWGTSRAPSFIFDAVPYFDLLLQDLGLAWRRKGGFWKEICSPYKPGDYDTVNGEWQAQHQV